MTTRTPTRQSQDSQLSADGAVAALRRAAEQVGQVAELAGHAEAAAEVLEAVERVKGECRPDGAQALRTAWVSAAKRSRGAYDGTTGSQRAREHRIAPEASEQLMRAFDVLGRITVRKHAEEGVPS